MLVWQTFHLSGNGRVYQTCGTVVVDFAGAKLELSVGIRTD